MSNEEEGYTDVCECCLHIINPTMCHCGDSVDRHFHDDHSFIPAGCTCGYIKDSEVEKYI